LPRSQHHTVPLPALRAQVNPSPAANSSIAAPRVQLEPRATLLDDGRRSDAV